MSVHVPQSPGNVQAQVLQGLAMHHPRSAPTQTADGTITVTRKIIPVWAVVVASIGWLLCLVGALFLLVRRTETLTIRVAEAEGGGSLVSAAGVAGLDTAEFVEGLLSSWILASAPDAPGGFVGPPGDHVG